MNREREGVLSTDGSVRVYNTLTRRKEPLVTRTPGEVRIYVCGITPYDLSHVGHARSAIVFDVIRRYLEFRGYRVTLVKNYTDVDDKIIRRANQEGVSPREVSERFIKAYDEDMDLLGVRAADVRPKATEHIPEMVALIERLLAVGVAYEVDGDVYFEIARFPAYGRLSGKNLDELLAGARVEVDERKRDPRDFALWKAAKPGEPSWPTPWGPGRPGWHIECSAMAMKYLGESLDLHGGGEDLVFPHHECEIAQSEAVTGRPFSRYWAHNAFINMGDEKMSKSLGNVLAIRELVKRHSRDAIRRWMLGAHYRSPIEFSEDRLRESGRALDTFARLFHDARAATAGATSAAKPSEEVTAHSARFIEAMDDDFNTPQAVGVLFTMADALGKRLVGAAPTVAAEVAAGVEELRRLGQALGLFEEGYEAAEAPADVLDLVEQRQAARSSRDWKRADALRDEILGRGWAVEDTPAGPRVSPRGA